MEEHNINYEIQKFKEKHGRLPKCEAISEGQGREIAKLKSKQGDTFISSRDISYPRDVFQKFISLDSPYAFYIFAWVRYQEDAKKWRLKMCHDVMHFDGRIEYGVWPNGNSCGSFKDDEVEFIRISKDQHGSVWEDPRGKPAKPLID